MGKKKTDYSKWSTAQLEKQHKTLKFATGLLAGLLIVLLLATIYISYRDKQLNPLLITPIALSVIIPCPSASRTDCVLWSRIRW